MLNKPTNQKLIHLTLPDHVPDSIQNVIDRFEPYHWTKTKHISNLSAGEKVSVMIWLDELELSEEDARLLNDINGAPLAARDLQPDKLQAAYRLNDLGLCDYYTFTPGYHAQTVIQEWSHSFFMPTHAGRAVLAAYCLLNQNRIIVA